MTDMDKHTSRSLVFITTSLLDDAAAVNDPDSLFTLLDLLEHLEAATRARLAAIHARTSGRVAIALAQESRSETELRLALNYANADSEFDK